MDVSGDATNGDQPRIDSSVAHSARVHDYWLGGKDNFAADRAAGDAVMADGMLVGYVPHIEGSEDFDEAQVVDAIARTDYDKPIATQRAAAPPPGPALTREGGVFRRFLDGFRYR